MNAKKIRMVGAVALCIIVLVASYVIASCYTIQKESEMAVMNLQMSQLENCLRSNISEVSALTAQISKLNKEILEQNSLIAQKDAEIKSLKRQVQDLKNQVAQIMGELETLEEIDEIRRLVERLQYTPAHTDVP